MAVSAKGPWLRERGPAHGSKEAGSLEVFVGTPEGGGGGLACTR